MGIFDRGRNREGGGRDAAGGTDGKAYRRALRDFAAGRFAAAGKAFREVAAVTPDDPEVQFLLGASLFNSGESEGAVAPLRRCVAMRPQHAEAHFALGMALGRTDELDEGVEHIAKGASLGDAKALEMLPKLGAEFCRLCARPAYYGSGDAARDVDILMVGPNIGMTCESCHLVCCGTCARTGTPPLNCPRCEGPLHPMTR